MKERDRTTYAASDSMPCRFNSKFVWWMHVLSRNTHCGRGLCRTLTSCHPNSVMRNTTVQRTWQPTPRGPSMSQNLNSNVGNPPAAVRQHKTTADMAVMPRAGRKLKCSDKHMNFCQRGVLQLWEMKPSNCSTWRESSNVSAEPSLFLKILPFPDKTTSIAEPRSNDACARSLAQCTNVLDASISLDSASGLAAIAVRRSMSPRQARSVASRR